MGLLYKAYQHACYESLKWGYEKGKETEKERLKNNRKDWEENDNRLSWKNLNDAIKSVQEDKKIG